MLVQLSLEKWGCNKGKYGGITPPNISTALDFLKMCAEMIGLTDQVGLGLCVTISPFYKRMTAPLNSLKLIKSGYFQYFLRVWPWNDLDVTLTWPWCYLTALQLLLMSLFAHKLRSRRGTCLALCFQTGSWMLLKESRNSNKMAAFYTVHTSSIRICIRPNTFSASQIDCTPLDSQMRVCRHHTGASPVFSIGSLSTGGGTGWQCWLIVKILLVSS